MTSSENELWRGIAGATSPGDSNYRLLWIVVTDPLPQDSWIDLLRKWVGASATRYDNDYRLLWKKLAALGGTPLPQDTYMDLLRKILPLATGGGNPITPSAGNRLTDPEGNILTDPEGNILVD